MDILLGLNRDPRGNDLRWLCQEWDEAHPDQPAQPEWLEEMITARARWAEMLRQHHPRQAESFARYDEMRSRLPSGLVVQALEALQYEGAEGQR
jgi:hypothetical protein